MNIRSLVFDLFAINEEANKFNTMATTVGRKTQPTTAKPKLTRRRPRSYNLS